jgi:hypothetical protein
MMLRLRARVAHLSFYHRRVAVPARGVDGLLDKSVAVVIINTSRMREPSLHAARC